MFTKFSFVKSMIISYNQLYNYEFFYTGQLSTGLKRFRRKYRRSHISGFIYRVVAERNLEISAAIVKLVMLFYAILDFSHLTHNPTLLASRDGLQTDNIEKMVNMSKI